MNFRYLKSEIPSPKSGAGNQQASECRPRCGSRITCRAFTMIEIAISLAVIGFALVAIIGILPAGMQTQKENREETIVNQEASVFMDAIRYGQMGLDDLTNYVFAITNWSTTWVYDKNGTPQRAPTKVFGYTYEASSVDGAPADPPYPIINGFRIVGLLSTPKYDTFSVPNGSSGFRSNHVVAFVRSLSGAATDKYPQNNASVQQLAFSYRLVSDVVTHMVYPSDPTNVAYASDLTNYLNYTNSTNPAEWQSRSNAWLYTRSLVNNLHDIRLTFRWPLQPNGDVNPNASRQVFRSMAAGYLLKTYEQGVPKNQQHQHNMVYFFRPRTYVQAP